LSVESAGSLLPEPKPSADYGFALAPNETSFERAARVGDRIVARFGRLAKRFDAIRDASGLGAMVAIEPVVEGQTKEPAKELIDRLSGEPLDAVAELVPPPHEPPGPIYRFRRRSQPPEGDPI
jgi:hypothetical protein